MGWCGTCCSIVRIIYSSLGLITGLAGFATFGFHFGNIEAGVWAILSGTVRLT